MAERLEAAEAAGAVEPDDRVHHFRTRRRRRQRDARALGRRAELRGPGGPCGTRASADSLAIAHEPLETPASLRVVDRAPTPGAHDRAAPPPDANAHPTPYGV